MSARRGERYGFVVVDRRRLLKLERTGIEKCAGYDRPSPPHQIQTTQGEIAHESESMRAALCKAPPCRFPFLAVIFVRFVFMAACGSALLICRLYAYSFRLVRWRINQQVDGCTADLERGDRLAHT